MRLEYHPDAPPRTAMAIAAEVQRSENALLFSFSISASADVVRMPIGTEPKRADRLWQTTCMEAFVRGDGERYAELNFSPSGNWAAYRFESYRDGMRNLQIAGPPAIGLSKQLGQLVLSARLILPPEFVAQGTPLALSAVVEEVDGTKSYWALAHRAGAPDFHHPDCFVARLP